MKEFLNWLTFILILYLNDANKSEDNKLLIFPNCIIKV